MKQVLIAYLYFLGGILIVLQPNIAWALDKNDSSMVAETKMTLKYLCTSNDSVTLTANLSVIKGDNILSLQKAAIDFFIQSGTVLKPAGKVFSDQEGNASLKIGAAGLTGNEAGIISYSAKFTGTDKYSPATADFSAKPARLQLSFRIQDSIRVLNVTATQKDARGNTVAIPKETILVYIPRLFSLLKIGEITLAEDGTGSFDFPNDIVGDTLGNITVVTRIEEHDKFGYVQGSNVINWGVQKQYYKAEVPSRELWTPIAPLWMIITLIIMLAGVWAHYVYAVYELIMIKHLGKKDKPVT